MFARRARRRPGLIGVRRGAARRRRGVAGVTLLAMIVCQLPAPIPVSAAASGKDRSALYPCRDRPCGCGSAAACWTGCCCFTNAQKVAWAEANGVTIPAFVHNAARREQTEAAPAAAPGACCGKPKPKSAAPKASCCETPDAACETQGEEEVDEEDAPPAPLGWMAQKCRGEIAACGALPWALRPTLFEGLTLSPAPWERPVTKRTGATSLEPPTPPPRRGLAATSS